MELERSADRARTRGGYVAEAAFLERALTLTADADRQGARALATAQAKLAAGEPRAARDLLALAERRPLEALEAVQLEVLRARIAFATGRGRDAPALLLKAAKSLEPLDPIAARDTYLDAIRAALFAGGFATDTQPEGRGRGSSRDCLARHASCSRPDPESVRNPGRRRLCGWHVVVAAHCGSAAAR